MLAALDAMPSAIVRNTPKKTTGMANISGFGLAIAPSRSTVFARKNCGDWRIVSNTFLDSPTALEATASAAG
jgi:hypothetical protein